MTFVLDIAPIAKSLLGEPNAALSSKTEFRYGSRGSLSIDVVKGTWFDHETNTGGGVLDLITRQTGLDGAERSRWLREQGFESERAKSSRLGTIVATYDYTDEVGDLLFQVVRYEPKDFRQRRPDAGQPDGWSWSVKGVRQVPYRLPDIIEQRQYTIFICEGEKDCDKLWDIGIPATTNAGGVGKWRPELSEHFRNADVVIIPDRDPQKLDPKTQAPMFHDDGRPVLPGQDHAQDIAAALAAVGATVRVLELWQFWPDMPLKGDVSDWLVRTGGTAKTLYEYAEQTPAWSPSKANGHDKQPAISAFAHPYVFPDPVAIPRRAWLYAGHYVREAVTATVAPGGFGKTTLTLFEVIDMAAQGTRCWYLSGEDSRDEIDRRIAAHCQRHEIIDKERVAANLFVDDRAGFPLFLGTSPRSAVMIADKHWPALFEQQITTNGIDVVALDPFISFHSVPENDNGAIDQIIKMLGLIAQRCKCCIEISHHVRKPIYGQDQLTTDDARGGGAIVNAVRSARVINRMSAREAAIAKVADDKRSAHVRIDAGKRNMKPPEAATWWRIIGVQLPNGDNVQAIEKYDFPSAFDGMSETEVAWVQDMLRAGPKRASSQSEDWLGHDIGVRCGRKTDDKAGVIWANAIIGTWLRNKVFKKVLLRGPDRKKAPFYAHNDFEDETESADILPFAQPKKKSGGRFRILGDCDEKTMCVRCGKADGNVKRIKDASQPGSKSETLHERCAAEWFDDV